MGFIKWLLSCLFVSKEFNVSCQVFFDGTSTGFGGTIKARSLEAAIQESFYRAENLSELGTIRRVKLTVEPVNTDMVVEVDAEQAVQSVIDELNGLTTDEKDLDEHQQRQSR